MWWRVVGAGATLGTLAFLADFLDSPWSALALFVSSSGFAWGCAALVAGFLAARAGRRARAVGAAVLLLAVATIVYYGLITADGSRWAGAVLADGSSAVPESLAAVLRATLFWLAASVAGGVVLGLLGHAIRHAGARLAAVAGGCAFALLAGQGAAAALRTGAATGWWFAEELAEVVAAGVVTAVLLTRRPGRRHWGRFAVAALVTAGAAVLAWDAISGLQVI